MDFQTWLGFLLASIFIAVSPGSGAVVSMSYGLRFGLLAASPVVWGLQAGLLLTLLIAGGGLGALITQSNGAFWTVKILGACYLIYLGAKQWKNSGVIEKIVPNHPNPSPDNPIDYSNHHIQAEKLPSLRQRFMTGFFTNATNPKGILFMVAVLPQFLNPHAALAPQLALMSATLLGVDVLVMHSYAGSASVLRRWMQGPAAQRWQNRVFGGVLMAMGLTLFFVQRG